MSEPYAQGDNWMLYHGDCRDVLRSLSAESVSVVVTSPAPVRVTSTEVGPW